MDGMKAMDRGKCMGEYLMDRNTTEKKPYIKNTVVIRKGLSKNFSFSPLDEFLTNLMRIKLRKVFRFAKCFNEIFAKTTARKWDNSDFC